MIDLTPFIVTGALLFLVFLVLLWRSLYNIAPFQQGVVTIVGSYKGILNPGFNVVSPIAHVVYVDWRSQHLAIP